MKTTNTKTALKYPGGQRSYSAGDPLPKGPCKHLDLSEIWKQQWLTAQEQPSPRGGWQVAVVTEGRWHHSPGRRRWTNRRERRARELIRAEMKRGKIRRIMGAGISNLSITSLRFERRFVTSGYPRDSDGCLVCGRFSVALMVPLMWRRGV